MTPMLLALLAAAQTGGGAATAAPYQSSPPRHLVAEPAIANVWLAGYRAQLTPSLMEDFGEKYLYAALDADLPSPPQNERRIVFIGDSITDLWELPRFFPGKPYVNRGIGGQVTAQLVLRFHQDVISLKPAVVVILAGINDLNGLLQKESDAGIEANWEAMAEMARGHGIRVVFGSILPVNNYTENARDMLSDRDPKRIQALNAWLAAFCKAQGHQLADYHAAVADDRGLLRAELTRDGIHPLAGGYALMAPIVTAAIDRALATPEQHADGRSER